MTEVPDHLLRRSRERREALGLDTGGGGEGGASPAADAPAAAPAGASVPATTAAAEVAAPAAARVPVVVDEPVPEPAYIRINQKQRSKNPLWVMPVLLGLPLWAFFYAFAFSPPKKAGPVDPLVLGAQLYKAKGCSGCHGPAGEGGVGPALAQGDAKLTFPNVADQVDWVKTGSQSKPVGTPYGDPNRAGGQRKVTKGVMPGFASSMTATEINAVVQYEREKL